MKDKFDNFTTHIQSDELGAKPGHDWINDFEEDDEKFIDD